MKLFRSVCLLAIAVVMCEADEDFTDDLYRNLARSYNSGSSENVDCIITYLKKLHHENLVLRASHLDNWKSASESMRKAWKVAESAVSNVSFLEV